MRKRSRHSVSSDDANDEALLSLTIQQTHKTKAAALSSPPPSSSASSASSLPPSRSSSRSPSRCASSSTTTTTTQRAPSSLPCVTTTTATTTTTTAGSNSSSTTRLPPPSFALAPLTPLPLWQRVVLSTLARVREVGDAQRRGRVQRRKLVQELTQHHASARARAARTLRQQREARARAGSRVGQVVQRYWSQRGDAYAQLLQVELDAVRHCRGERRRDAALRLMEETTRRLVERLRTHRTSLACAAADEQNTTTTTTTTNDNNDDDVGSGHNNNNNGDAVAPLEASLALLDTQHGARPLRHYQRSALHWLVHLYECGLNGILADEMGLGKTVQTIALLCYYAQYKNDWGPHLIVVPTTVLYNWVAELQRWAPGLRVLAYCGSAKERARLRSGWTRDDALHVCVTSYNLVVRDRASFRRRPWGFLVLDEAHHLRSATSARWQALFDLQAAYRLLLTGTPLQSSVMELWSLLHLLLPAASAFRSHSNFREWYGNPLEAMVTGRTALHEATVRRLQALLRPFLLRRLKRDVDAQLPSKTEVVVLCRLSRRQRALYDDYMALAETRACLRGGGSRGGSSNNNNRSSSSCDSVAGGVGILGVLLALRKVCDHPDLFEPRPTLSPLVLGYTGALVVRVPRAVLLLSSSAAALPSYRFSGNCSSNSSDADEAVQLRMAVRQRFPRVTDVVFDDCNMDDDGNSNDDDDDDDDDDNDDDGDSESVAWLRVLPCVFAYVDCTTACACATSTHVRNDALSWCTRPRRGDVVSSWSRRLDARLLAQRVAAAAAAACSHEATATSAPSTAMSSSLCDVFADVVRAAAATRARRLHSTLQMQHTRQQRTCGASLCCCAYTLRTVRQPLPTLQALLLPCQQRRGDVSCVPSTLRRLCPTVAQRVAALMPLLRRVAVYVPRAHASRRPQLHCALPLPRAAAAAAVYTAPDRARCAQFVASVARVQEACRGYTYYGYYNNNNSNSSSNDRRGGGGVYAGMPLAIARSYLCYDTAATTTTFAEELWPLCVRRCFGFPDERLLIHDCGKLQFLARALPPLRAEGHRALIFTQFVQMLNLLERFLALLGVSYLRLDGATRGDVRLALVDRFNADPRITCMLLSTRSGGIGINLTGADTVIFYDSDWNPTMDLQAQDRAHRIGQTRAVTIYRLVSEHTVEEGIVRRARQRKKLNNVVIRGGQFHAMAEVASTAAATTTTTDAEATDAAAAALLALAQPVNLRSFFHDLDEDATLVDEEVGNNNNNNSSNNNNNNDSTNDDNDTATTLPDDVLRTMRTLEDDEDRRAQLLVEQEMRQRAADDAADDAADGVAALSSTDGDTAMATAAVAGNDKDSDGATTTAAAASSPLRAAVRMRQREVVARRARTPLDRLLMLSYGCCRADDARARYEALYDAFVQQQRRDGDDDTHDEADGREDGDEDDDAAAMAAEAEELLRFRPCRRIEL